VQPVRDILSGGKKKDVKFWDIKSYGSRIKFTSLTSLQFEISKLNFGPSNTSLIKFWYYVSPSFGPTSHRVLAIQVIKFWSCWHCNQFPASLIEIIELMDP